MKKRQRGFSITEIFLWGVVLALIGIIAMKAVPSFIPYKSVLAAVKRIANDAGSSGTVAKVKADFTKQMEVDNIKTITADDLDIYKENNIYCSVDRSHHCVFYMANAGSGCSFKNRIKLYLFNVSIEPCARSHDSWL